MPDEQEPQRYGWATDSSDGTTSWFGGGSPVPLPDPPKPSGPIEITLMTDDVAGIALWPDLAWDYPGSPHAELFGKGEPKDVLPITDDLRRRIRAWVDDWESAIGRRTTRAWGHEHDERGRVLAAELQEQLGPAYLIEFPR